MSAQERREALVGAVEGRVHARPRLLVGSGGCGKARGADAVLAALREEVAARGSPVEVVAGACNGMCYAQVLVTVQPRRGPALIYGGITPSQAPKLLNFHLSLDRAYDERAGPAPDGYPRALRAGAEGLPAPLAADRGEPWEGGSGIPEVPFLAGQTRLLTMVLGLIDPEDVEDAFIWGEAYDMLARVLDTLTPDELIEQVRAAKLLGRGGAYFPTAAKWQAARAAPGEPKWLVANAEEGEPGVYKDRHLLEGDPHRVLEGMLLAAYAVGASRGIVYVNGEARLAQQRLEWAINQARARGLIGEQVLGSPFSFEVEVRHGSGGYILGEETALLESIEGQRAMPRVRPPFPVERGLWGRPTVVNNVETLANLPGLVRFGADQFARTGLPNASGTKLIGLSGNIARPGLVEVAFGTTMRRLVEDIGGGVPNGRALKAVLIGGPSGVFVPPSALDEPIQPGGVVPPGTGGWVVLDDRQSIVGAARQMTEFNMLESCGKCTPCREGTVRLLDLLDRFEQGQAAPSYLQQLRELCDVVGTASLCGLGQMAPRPILSALQFFEAEFTAPRHEPGRLG